MNIAPTAQVRQIRCLKCGNSFFPQGLTGLLVTCPVVGCNNVFNPADLPAVHMDPEQQNIIAGAVTEQGNGAASPLNFGRNDAGEVIVSGVNGSPATISIPAMVNGRAVVGIGPRAFADQVQLRRVTMPDTVSVIGEDAFAGCSELESVTFGKGLRLLDKGCFRDCVVLDSVTLPAKVEEIGRDAFARCCALEQVELTSPVKVIRDGAFSLCDALTVFTYPVRPARIASSAFSGCYGLPQQLQDELFSTSAQ